MSGVLVCSGSWPSDGLRFGKNPQVPEIISRAYASAGCSRHAHVAVVTKGTFSLQRASEGHPVYMLELTSVPEGIAEALAEAFHSPQLLDEDDQGMCHCGIMWLPDETIPSKIETFNEPVYHEVRDSIIQLAVSGAAKLLESLRRCNARVLEQAETRHKKSQHQFFRRLRGVEAELSKVCEAGAQDGANNSTSSSTLLLGLGPVCFFHEFLSSTWRENASWSPFPHLFSQQNLELQPPQLVRGLQDPSTSTPEAAWRCRAHLISSLGETLRTGEAQWPRGAHIIYTKTKRSRTRSSRTRRTHIVLHAGKDSTQSVLFKNGGHKLRYLVCEICSYRERSERENTG